MEGSGYMWFIYVKPSLCPSIAAVSVWDHPRPSISAKSAICQ